MRWRIDGCICKPGMAAGETHCGSDDSLLGRNSPPTGRAVTALMSKLISQHNKSVPATAQALPHARLHDLRHLHATTLLLAGVPVHVVAARLGHADPAVTLRVYSHVLREHARGVGDIFAQAVEAAVSKSVSTPRQLT